MSNMILSQNTNTANTNKKCIDDNQVTEIYKSLKQNDYLKIRLKKTEVVLDESNNIIKHQKDNIEKLNEIVKQNENSINLLNLKIDKEKEICENSKIQFQEKIKLIEIENKKAGKKKFWNGFKVGGLTVGILGAATILLLK